MKLKKPLLIIAIAVMTIGVVLFIAAVVLSFIGQSNLADVFLGVSAILGVAALALLVFNLYVTSKTIQPVEVNKPKVVVKVVDVKDLPKTKEQQLYEQYENLYNQGLITKDDLDNKRKELLNK